LPKLEEADEMQHEAYDRYMTARVCVPQGDTMSYGTVMTRKRGQNGELLGHSNANPILDTSIYEVEFDDGSTGAYSANIIAKHIYSQVDGEGCTQYMLNEIVRPQEGQHGSLQGGWDHHHQERQETPKANHQGMAVPMPVE